jgi:hypothetical protein
VPHYLTASIFSAQSGEVAVFHRNVRLLVLLCVTSGIFRSKSCMVEVPFFLKLQIIAWHSFFFFGLKNMILGSIMSSLYCF